MITTIWGTTRKPAAAQQLSERLESDLTLDGTLYIGYPIIGTPDGAFPLDAVLLSPNRGLVAFNLVEGKGIDGFEQAQDETFNKLTAKLFQYPSLTQGRQLGVLLTVITYVPAIANINSYARVGYPLANNGNLLAEVEKIHWDQPHLYDALASVIQAISTIRKGRRRPAVSNSESRGAKVRRLEDSIANLDSRQSEAVIETVDGVQRIRGLAGSGKTIVLALKVAYLHAQHPDWKIAVTFNTRSLKEQFRKLINNFAIEQTSEEPDWGQIDIIHAWGSPAGSSDDGIYYRFCTENGATYFDFGSARDNFGDKDPFGGACKSALAQAVRRAEIYDVILVDEAQDFSPSFLQICHSLLRQPKRLVYAYDELQSLTETSLPSPEEIFGNDSAGRPLVVFGQHRPGQPRQDITLDVCYRNSRPVLATAHALGFGVYREPGGLVQIFDEPSLWKEVGYRIADGDLADGRRVMLERTDRTSPQFLETHSPLEDLIQFSTFASEEEQTDWLVKCIEHNIKVDELLPEDIVVINPDPKKTKRAVAAARAKLFAMGINSNIAGVTNSRDIFFQPNVVTFTGVFRAKGNEAAMVYVINGQDCFSSYLPSELATARSRLFTAITRSKAWVRVSGIGPRMGGLAEEFQRVAAHNFTLDFTYPTAAQREKLKIINRDRSEQEKSALKMQVQTLSELLGSIEAGQTSMGDIPDELRERLQRFLRGE
ncbi:helicase [Trinickia symbiotica]|uniref:DNA 3'-5' helicase II n=1 Tax=Trinickia symbiotica TaxID=863227 RepID=A0A2T3XP15_9BURK|nr:ATP-binding domain-containing protein [Trinickia symbiotica]PTB18266.1 helicase [Trinickia symbiotica]